MEETKLIAFDLDDTLLDTGKRLPEKNREALIRVAEKGVRIVPATGRLLRALPAELSALPFVRYVITANGAAVYDRQTGTEIDGAHLTPSCATGVMAYLDGFDVIYDCYIGDAAYMSAEMRERCTEYTDSPFYKDRLYHGRIPVADLKRYVTERGEGVAKVQLYAKHMTDRATLLRTLPERFPDTAVSSSVVNNVEINDARATKGDALIRLAGLLNIPVRETAAIGDGLNDVTMIRAAGTGIAMGNACAEARAAADAVAPGCDADGFAYALEQILRI